MIFSDLQNTYKFYYDPEYNACFYYALEWRFKKNLGA